MSPSWTITNPANPENFNRNITKPYMPKATSGDHLNIFPSLTARILYLKFPKEG
jgi:hypothetical protein